MYKEHPRLGRTFSLAVAISHSTAANKEWTALLATLTTKLLTIFFLSFS